MTSPSAGDSPIEVSTLRPPAIAHALAPLPRCSTTRWRSSGARPDELRGARATRTRRRCRGSRSGARRAARATRAGTAYVDACGGRVAVEPGVEDGDVRDVGKGVPRPFDARRRWRGCAAARGRPGRASADEDVVVDQHRVGEPGPAVDDPVTDGEEAAAEHGSVVGSAPCARGRRPPHATGCRTRRSEDGVTGLVVQVRRAADLRDGADPRQCGRTPRRRRGTSARTTRR